MGGLFAHPHPENFHENIVASIIGAVDLYLIAVVMFIFAFGIVSELIYMPHIDEAESHGKRYYLSSLRTRLEG